MDEREGAGLEASGESDEHYYDVDAAQSDYDLPDTGGESCLQAIVDSDSSQTVKFYWKVSSEQSHDYLQFYIDSTLKDQISGEVGWQQKSYPVDAGIHILKWRYVKDGSGQSGDDCGWVDFVQWTGPSPTQDPANWQEIAYKHDLAGRRVEKKVDGYSTRYVHDGRSVIAEYDGNNNLLRKYVAGPDGPVCMIEVAASNATYYYHYDGRGNVVALTDSVGDTVQTYEYSVFGEVAVEDANHPNPYMFGGMRFEAETGLYYLGGPVYNPYIGRLLQQNFGIHWERYDWSGTSPQADEPAGAVLTFVRFANGDFGFLDIDEDVPDGAVLIGTFSSIDDWIQWAMKNPDFGLEGMPDWTTRTGAKMSKNDPFVFWSLQALIYLGYEWNYAVVIEQLEGAGVTIDTTSGYWKPDGTTTNNSEYQQGSKTVLWNTTTNDGNYYNKPGYETYHQWFKYHPLTALAHELGHAIDALDGPIPYGTFDEKLAAERYASAWENIFRYMFYKKVPGRQEGEWEMLPKPQCGVTAEEDHIWWDNISWDQFFGRGAYAGKGAWVVQP